MYTNLNMFDLTTCPTFIPINSYKFSVKSSTKLKCELFISHIINLLTTKQNFLTDLSYGPTRAFTTKFFINLTQ